MRTFQLTSTFDNLSVVDNLVLSFLGRTGSRRCSSCFSIPADTARKEEQIVELSETSDLQDVRDRQVRHLSLGE